MAGGPWSSGGEADGCLAPGSPEYFASGEARTSVAFPASPPRVPWVLARWQGSVADPSHLRRTWPILVLLRTQERQRISAGMEDAGGSRQVRLAGPLYLAQRRAAAQPRVSLAASWERRGKECIRAERCQGGDIRRRMGCA
jgi:hypothetical protein